MTTAAPQLLRFGSFHGRLYAADQVYLDALALVFGVGILPLTPDQDAWRQFDLTITVSPIAEPRSSARGPGNPANQVRLDRAGDVASIATDSLRTTIHHGARPAAIEMIVLKTGLPFDELCVHFGVVIHKLLFHFDRLMLHAAAVDLDGGVCLFVGDKGAGKSTTTLALARAGGRVLGEDQCALWRSPDGFVVSGNDERSRLTERTERHFFPESLPVAARDFAGTLKKEITMKAYFHSEPFRDFPARRLLFPRVTGTFDLRPLKAREALRRMLAYNGHFQRFAGASDQAAFLDFLAGFVASVSSWELFLSDDLTQLDALAGQLRGG